MLKGLSVVSLLLSLLLMMECIEAPPNPFDEPPRITENPKDQSVLIENKATFSVKASGLNLKYQWYKDTTVISGATDSNYTIHQVNSGHDSMTYHCVVKNDNGEATSKSALLTVM